MYVAPTSQTSQIYRLKSTNIILIAKSLADQVSSELFYDRVDFIKGNQI